MLDETQFIEKKTLDSVGKNESRLGNMSLRGAIALIITLTICIMSLMKKEVSEPLYTLGGMVLAYYFGQNKKQTQ